jgi:hypothetical protein
MVQTNALAVQTDAKNIHLIEVVLLAIWDIIW